MKISYLGNEFLEEDNLAVKVADKIRERVDAEFQKIDTFEAMMDLEDNQYFMDVCEGVKRPVIISDIDKFLTGKSVTAHDIDFNFFMKLQHELGELKTVNIICIPQYPYDGIEEDVITLIQGVSR